MFKVKKILSCIFASALIFSLSSVSAFAADNSIEKENLQTAITEGRTAPVASSPVLTEEKAKEIIDKLNETAETIEVQVTRPSTTKDSIGPQAAVDVAVVKCRPTYGYSKLNGATGHVSVYLDIWVEGGGISALINKVKGYAAFATNVEGVREEINHIPIHPSRLRMLLKKVTLE